ncbi:MAG: DUF4230 domain-containing protein [Phycisphaeraceae bacterium]|nr:DUF4230 domain-containing protein [Phycisphaeraceae bacterium]
MIDITPLILIGTGLALGGLGVWFVTRKFRGWSGSRRRQERIVTQTIAERVRAVGKLVALEVFAKEIATATTGWAWLPPLLLSQARLAMIFNFEKQYFVDLSRVRTEDVERLEPEVAAGVPTGGGRFRVRLPKIEGSLRTIDITPYDIQNARVLGLLDVIPMTADRQRDLMKRAQEQAAELYKSNDERYLREAKLSAERHLKSLMELFGVRVEVVWDEGVPFAARLSGDAPAERSADRAIEAASAAA